MSTKQKYSKRSQSRSRSRSNKKDQHKQKDDRGYNRYSEKRSSDEQRKNSSHYHSSSKISSAFHSSSHTNYTSKPNSSTRENPIYQISSGPLLFKGNGSIKQTPLPPTVSGNGNNSNSNSSKNENTEFEIQDQILDFQKPIPKKTTFMTSDTDQEQFQTQILDEYQAFQWEELENDAERNWYDQQENGGVVVDEQDNYFVGDRDQFRAIQNTIEQKKGTNFKESERNMEHNKWEEKQMITSGVFRKIEIQNEIEEDDENRVTLIVHDYQPPFLDGKQNVYTKQAQMVQIVKDPNSEMALLAKKGSAVLQAQREKNDRAKMRQRFWELSGSHMGNLLKVKKNQQADELDEDLVNVNDQGDLNYQKGSQYAVALSKPGNQEGASDFSRNQTIKQQREYLPVYSVRDELLQVINENRVIIIVGETGSGQTTQLTQYLYENGYTTQGIIGCTQPRRVAAVSVAKRVADEMGIPLGTQVGYSIRFEDCTSQETIIKYMTDGVLLRQSLNDPDLEMYSAIVMDQAHERSLNTDVLFGILLQVAQRRRDIKLIITSATMNSEKFSSFFGGAPIFNIPGRTFPVTTRFEKSAADDYVNAAVQKAIEVHVQQPMGDILIFMTGQEDIQTTCVLLAERVQNLQNSEPMLILPIYSQLRSQEQARIFDRSKLRQCIVATNIAETSLTLDGVKYVIDTGYAKIKVYNPRIGMDALQITPISQANANQRSGRAGRTGPGICFRLYSDSNFRSDFLQNNIPEIQRTNLSNVVLLLKTLNIDDLLQFNFMDPPPQETILNSMYQLWILGCLDNIGNITTLGKKMAQFPLDPPLAKMLIIASELSCTEEILTVVSMLSIPSIFYRPQDRESQSDAAREKLFISESDHLTLLNVYEQWKKHSFSAEWCKNHFIQVKSLRQVREVRSQLKDIAEQMGLKITSCNYNYDVVRKAICSAYFINAAQIQSIGDYVNMRNGMPCQVHPSSAIFSLGYAPDYVVYHQLIMTSQQYMHCVTTVDPYWLAELGPMFFSVKDFGADQISKNQIEKENISLIEKQIEEAQLKMIEIKKSQLEQEEKDKEARRMQSQVLAYPGQTPIRTNLQTPKIHHI